MISAALHRVILQTALRSLLSVALFYCFFSIDKFTGKLHLHDLFFRTKVKSAGKNQVRQSEHPIQFGSLLVESSVSRFSISELTFYYGKDVFDFCPDE